MEKLEQHGRKPFEKVVGVAEDRKGRKQTLLTCLFCLPYGLQKAKGTEGRGERTFMHLLEGEK